MTHPANILRHGPSLLLSAGVGLALAAALWRWLGRAHRRRRARRSLGAALADRDPAVRRSAVAEVGSQGLSPFADLLLRCASTERDPTVKRALAAAVARRQWEPLDSPAVMELRLWAHRLLEEPQATETEAWPVPPPAAPPETVVRTAAPRAAVAPRKAAPKAFTAPLPSSAMPLSELLAPVQAHPAYQNRIRSGGSGPGGVGAGWNGSGAPSVLSSMAVPSRTSAHWFHPAALGARAGEAGQGLTVIVTGAGGPAGVAVIRALKAQDFRVIGADADGLAVGLRLAHEGAVLPSAGDPLYVTELIALVGATGATALTCTVAEEMLQLSQATDLLREAGLACWIPSPEAINACLDKWRFVQMMRRAGVRVPDTGLGTVDRVPGPWIVKPRFGRGSRDVYTADDSRDLSWALNRVEQPLVQTRVTGREFTVDALVDLDGTLAGAVPRWRLETRAGISTKGRTFSDPSLVRATGEVLDAVGLTGPANVQGFIDEQGTITFIEVNPRFSGGLPLSLAAGADLVGEYLRGVMGLPLRPERLAFRSGVTMIRHFEEVFET